MTRIVQINAPPTAKASAFVRIAIANALAKSEGEVEYVARSKFGDESLACRIAQQGGLQMLAVAKAEVAAGATVSGSWAEILAETERAATEFFALVRERSLLGRITGLRRVPLRTRLMGVASGFAAHWVGEGKAVPVSAAIFDETAIARRKVAALTVVTDELLESADPMAEITIRDDLVGAVVEAINASLIDPANNGTAGVEPASITNGVPSVAATGDGLADIRQLIDIFPGDLERAVLIGSPNSFAAMHDPLVLPGLGVRGGNALGIPAIASTAAGSTLALVDPDGIAWGGADTEIRTSREATIEMLDSALTGDSFGVVPPTAASTVSLWQTNSSALVAEQHVNWEAARPSVATLTGVDQS